MLPISSLSRVAYELRDLFVSHIDDFNDYENIRIGHPADTIKELEVLDDSGLNMFFYDVNYDGYPADGSSDNPFYVRINCLITAVGQKSSEPDGTGSRDVSKGENELRLIGEVMRVLHEQPVLSIDDGDDNEIAQLQVIPYTMNLDNLNHIWSTQSETSYRLSVAYEMSLAPVPFRQASDSSPLVTDSPTISVLVKSNDTQDNKKINVPLKPIVEYLEIDTEDDDWIPHICFVENAGSVPSKLHYVYLIDDDFNKQLDILIAAKNNASVKLVWNIWRRKKDNSVVAWKDAIADKVEPLLKEIKDADGATEPFHANRIDPENIDSRRIFQVKLPDDIKDTETKSWQAMLYAIHERSVETSPGSGNFKTLISMSNSVLLYGEGV